MRYFNQIITAIFVLLLMCNITAAKIIYVDDDATGANDGSSWENAYVFLQDALADASNWEKPVEIKVAQGIYTPDKVGGKSPGDIEAAFNLINGVTIAGGYSGAADPNERDIELYETILSGDLLGNDEPVAEPSNLFPETEQDSRYDNSYNVVAANNVDETAVLDGFTIIGGVASYYSSNDIAQKYGGGLYSRQSTPIISNCTFMLNAAWDGGAMYNLNSSPTLTNCRFDKNAAISEEDETEEVSGYGGSGGAMLNFNSNPTVTNCSFTGNYSTSGGGMVNYVSSPIMTNCLFEDNYAKNGGGVYNFFNMPILTSCRFIENQASIVGGGMLNVNSEPDLTDCSFISNKANEGGAISSDTCNNTVISNCNFIDNSALSGGAMTNWYTNLTITNSIFSGNAAFDGGAIQNWTSDITITNCLVTGNASEQGGVLQNLTSDLFLANCTIAGNALKIYTGYFPSDSNNLEDDIIPPPISDDEIPDYNLAPSNVNCVNCIIRDDANFIWDSEDSIMTIRYSNISGGFEGIGNIDEDPLFAESGYWADPNDPNIATEPNNPNAVWIDGDYHLKSQAGRWYQNSRSWVIDDVTSPCIDTGDPDTPVGDEPQPNGGRINMGAYGGSKEASMSLTEQ